MTSANTEDTWGRLLVPQRRVVSHVMSPGAEKLCPSVGFDFALNPGRPK